MMKPHLPDNQPRFWKNALPVKTVQSHKYSSGLALIYGAPELTGATRLAAAACARMGAGLVTVLCAKASAAIYRASLPPHILVRDDLRWRDERVAARLYGPGGLSVKPDFKSGLPTVLDADALYSLPETLAPNFALTPHEGEFARIFPGLEGSREERALHAARTLQAHIVLKGAATVIAAPDGRAALNTHASPWLASAGTGDVLAGMIAGLLAQGMPVFEACCAAVWIHGECGLRIGPGLVASDLPDLIPGVLQSVLPA